MAFFVRAAKESVASEVWLQLQVPVPVLPPRAGDALCGADGRVWWCALQQEQAGLLEDVIEGRSISWAELDAAGPPPPPYIHPSRSRISLAPTLPKAAAFKAKIPRSSHTP
eukprot:3067302-Rhodomonas_salina.3